MAMVSCVRCLPLAFGLALLAGLGPDPAALAVPRLDLTPYPAPQAGERRWVIQLPGVLPPSGESAFSSHPADWRVQLIVGQDLEVDCNSRVLSGRIRAEVLKGWGYPIYRVGPVGPMATTRMACPPEEPKRRAFVPVGANPYVVPYNASLPIVIYAPAHLEVRWRLWKAETRQQPARAL
ncbi:MAG: ecotin family protein [Cyanobacteriota bacterium]|nr:ecotin family protein [Cyanobacteriota bacterium]